MHSAGTDAVRSTALSAGLVSGLVLVASVDAQGIGALAPEIADSLGAPAPVIAASVVFYSSAAGLVALAVARFWRRLDPAASLPAAAALFALASAAAALAPGIATFFAARALAGAAGGLVSALSVAALANASSYASRGKQMTGVAVSYFIAPIAGVPLGAVAADRFGWRAVFAFLAVAAIAVGLLVRRYPLPATSGRSLEAAPASLLVLLTRSRSTAFGVAGAFFVSGGLVAFTSFLGTWLSDAFGVPTRTVGLVYAVAGIGAVAGGAFGGTLADRFGKRRVAAASSFAMVALLPAVAVADWGPALFAGVAATALAAALRVAPLQALLTELVAPSERAAYIALRNTASQVGIAVSVAAGEQVYRANGMRGVAWMCASLTLVAWLSTWLIREPEADPEPAEVGGL